MGAAPPITCWRHEAASEFALQVAARCLCRYVFGKKNFFITYGGVRQVEVPNASLCDLSGDFKVHTGNMMTRETEGTCCVGVAEEAYDA